MNRRQILLGTAALMMPTVPALAETRAVRYNFNLNLGSRLGKSAKSSYGGKQTVAYSTREVPGTIVVNTRQRALYFVLNNGKAIRYGVGVGRRGFSWKGAAHVRRKTKWPAWYPHEEIAADTLTEWQGDPLRCWCRAPGFFLEGCCPHPAQGQMAGLVSARRDAQA